MHNKPIYSRHFLPEDSSASTCVTLKHHLVGHLCQSINKHRNHTWPWLGGSLTRGGGGGVMQLESLPSAMESGVCCLDSVRLRVSAPLVMCNGRSGEKMKSTILIARQPVPRVQDRRNAFTTMSVHSERALCSVSYSTILIWKDTRSYCLCANITEDFCCTTVPCCWSMDRVCVRSQPVLSWTQKRQSCILRVNRSKLGNNVTKVAPATPSVVLCKVKL